MVLSEEMFDRNFSFPFVQRKNEKDDVSPNFMVIPA